MTLGTDVTPIKLVASMLVRNELDRYQPQLARHLLSYVDEIRVLDDCSTDGSGIALARLDPRIKVQSLMGASDWEHWGEGHVRQRLLDWTMMAKPTHVLAVDADEFIPNGQRLRKMLRRNPDADVFTLRMVEIWRRVEVPWQMRVDGEWSPRPVPICWRVPAEARRTGHLPDGWNIAPRRMASGREPEIVAALAGFGDAVDTGCDICHLGWSDQTERRPRYERYMRIDGGDFHASAHLQSIIEPPELEDYPAYPDVLAEPAPAPAPAPGAVPLRHW